MQYPPEGLQLLVYNSLHPQKMQQLCLQEEFIKPLKNEIISVSGKCRIAICQYIATAANEQQALYMVHAMNVALNELKCMLTRHESLLQAAVKDTRGLHFISEAYTLMSDQIEVTLLFLENNFASVKDMQLPAYLRKQKITEADKPIITNLSVPQLALFIRLLTDTGIIAGNSNIAMLVNKTAGIVQTKKTAQISSESLRIKYYTPEKAAINILKEYIAQMMNLLRSY